MVELDDLQAEQIDEADVATALAEFDTVWELLASREQARVLHLLIERVEHDGATGDVTLTFQPTGLASLSATLEETAA